MKLSSLQKYVLLEGLGGKKFSRDKLIKFYRDQKVPGQQPVKVISRSLERLIDKELLIGYGIRTPHKWFIREIKLTVKGRQTAKRLLGKQQRLPFKVKIEKLKGKSTS